MTARRLKILPLLLCMCCVCCSCTSVREGREVIDAADSLRVYQGVTYDDSIALAQAYTTFGRVQHIYPNEYARACYYYGRLLRNHGDQVAAMQAFINGSHAPYWHRLIPLPQFTDYHILGRIYSNMGTMCQAAREYDVAYKLFEQSAEQFRQSGELSLCYYATNVMAVQLAELKRHDETLSLLKKIECECSDSSVHAKTWETRALLYKNIGLYDSTIYVSRELLQRGYSGATVYILQAQAYWYLQQYDSALYYANIAVNMPDANSHDKYNMMYILAYNDSSISSDEVKKRSEERADIDKEILDPLHTQLTRAMDLLSKDANKTRAHWAVLLVMITIIFIITIIRKRHKTRIAHIEKKEIELSAKEQALQHKQDKYRDTKIQEIENVCESLRTNRNLTTQQGMANYAVVKKVANKKFNMLVDKLEATHVLSEQKIKFCILVLLKVPQKQIAAILGYSEVSIKNTKATIAKDLHVSSLKLRELLISMCLE